MPTHILVVDDEVSIHELVAEYLLGRGWTVDVARDGREARALLAVTRYDVMLTDLKLPDVDGLELVRHASRRLPPVPGVVMTGYATVEGVVRALRLGASDFVLKPFKLRDLYTLLEGAVARARQQRDTAAIARGVEFFESAEVANDRAAALALSGLLVDTIAAMDGIAYVQISRGGTPLVQLGTRTAEVQEWSLPGEYVLRIQPPTPRVEAYVLATERALRRGGF